MSLCFFSWCLALTAMAAPDRPAAGPSPAPAAENRFLLVVDTSTAMRQFKHEGRQFVFDLLFADLSQLMQPGDTFGVWTFNQEVSGGVFPMQVWQPAQKIDLASKVTLFLQLQRYEKASRLGAVWAKLLAQINTIKDVNVVIVTSGHTQLGEVGLGETFQPIWEVKAALAQNLKQPMVIALAARKGQIVNWAISTANEPLDFPQPPKQLTVSPPATPPKNEKSDAPAPKALATSKIPLATNEPLPVEPPPVAQAVPNKPPTPNHQPSTINHQPPQLAPQTPAPIKPPAPSIILKGPQPLITNSETPVPAAISSDKPTNTPPITSSTPAQTSAPPPLVGRAVPSEPPATNDQPSTINHQPPPAQPSTLRSTVTEDGATLNSLWFWISGAGLLTGLCVGAGVWRYRRRRVRASFITRSMER